MTAIVLLQYPVHKVDNIVNIDVTIATDTGNAPSKPDANVRTPRGSVIPLVSIATIVVVVHLSDRWFSKPISEVVLCNVVKESNQRPNV